MLISAIMRVEGEEGGCFLGFYFQIFFISKLFIIEFFIGNELNIWVRKGFL